MPKLVEVEVENERVLLLVPGYYREEQIKSEAIAKYRKENPDKEIRKVRIRNNDQSENVL